jgi:hypothetical protein
MCFWQVYSAIICFSLTFGSLPPYLLTSSSLSLISLALSWRVHILLSETLPVISHFVSIFADFCVRVNAAFSWELNSSRKGKSPVELLSMTALSSNAERNPRKIEREKELHA